MPSVSTNRVWLMLAAGTFVAVAVAISMANAAPAATATPSAVAISDSCGLVCYTLWLLGLVIPAQTSTSSPSSSSAAVATATSTTKASVASATNPIVTYTPSSDTGGFFGPMWEEGHACNQANHDDCASHCCFEDKCANPAFCGTKVPSPAGKDLQATCTTNAECASQCCNAGVCSRYGKCNADSVDPATIPKDWLDSTTTPHHLRLLSPTQWCLLFPTDWVIVGDNEFKATLMCSEAMVAASGGKLRAAPKDVIPKAWFGAGTDGNGTSWVQFSTSSLSPAPYYPGDSGGQYDSNGEPDPSSPLRGAPRGSGCMGYDQMVQLFNPAKGVLCTRCCKGPATDSLCNWRYSGMWCEFVFPGIQMSDE